MISSSPKDQNSLLLLKKFLNNDQEVVYEYKKRVTKYTDIEEINEITLSRNPFLLHSFTPKYELDLHYHLYKGEMKIAFENQQNGMKDGKISGSRLLKLLWDFHVRSHHIENLKPSIQMKINEIKKDHTSQSNHTIPQSSSLPNTTRRTNRNISLSILETQVVMSPPLKRKTSLVTNGISSINSWPRPPSNLSSLKGFSLFSEGKKKQEVDLSILPSKVSNETDTQSARVSKWRKILHRFTRKKQKENLINSHLASLGEKELQRFETV